MSKKFNVTTTINNEKNTEEKRVKSLKALTQNLKSEGFTFPQLSTASSQLSRNGEIKSKCGKCAITYTDSHVIIQRGKTPKRKGGPTQNQKNGQLKRQNTMNEPIIRDEKATTIAEEMGKKLSKTLTTKYRDENGETTTIATEAGKKRSETVTTEYRDENGETTTIAKKRGEKSSKTVTTEYRDENGETTTIAKKRQTARNEFSALVASQTVLFSETEIIDKARKQCESFVENNGQGSQDGDDDDDDDDDMDGGGEEGGNFSNSNSNSGNGSGGGGGGDR